jgi:hypothetical protein
MNSLRIPYRRLQTSYRCHRQRGKSHLQLLLEVLARTIAPTPIATQLMQYAMRRHSICRDLDLAQVLKRWNSRTAEGTLGNLLCTRFFVDVQDDALWASYRTQFRHKIQAVIEDAEALCRHEFRLLGSGVCQLGEHIDWHCDPVSGYRWPKNFAFGCNPVHSSPDGSDVKWPWELSRMQHLPTLGKAYRLTQNERYAREIVDQVTHWLDDNPCAFGVNWTCAMDVAIRIMNMIWGYRFIEDAGVVSEAFKGRLLVAMVQHAQFILFHLEYSIRDDGSLANGNHYLANVVGLLHLGLLCPNVPLAQIWRRVGLRALVEEMDRQVHPDGSDFESSVSYHRLVLELFISGALLCRIHHITLPARFWQRLEKMFDFVLGVTRPDGTVPQVGDADDGRLYILSNYGHWDRTDLRYLLSIGAVLFHRRDMKACTGGFAEDAFWLLGPDGLADFEALEDGATAMGTQAFPDAGLYVMRSGDRYLLACCGQVGTAGLGNHKHNDLLSFELYAGDKAFIVDPGSYVYTRHPEWRNRFRSTLSHNTVVIDTHEQNRFQDARLFAMAEDAAVIVHAWSSTPEMDWLDVEHTGYGRLAPPVRHRRIFRFDKGPGRWDIIDILIGAGDHTADWYLHFDHRIALEPVGEGIFRTCCSGTDLVIAMSADIPLDFKVEDGWVSRRYGCKLAAKVLHICGTFNTACHTVLRMHTV